MNSAQWFGEDDAERQCRLTQYIDTYEVIPLSIVTALRALYM